MLMLHTVCMQGAQAEAGGMGADVAKMAAVAAPEAQMDPEGMKEEGGMKRKVCACGKMGAEDCMRACVQPEVHEGACTQILPGV
jgi:hypothetical protein